MKWDVYSIRNKKKPRLCTKIKIITQGLKRQKFVRMPHIRINRFANNCLNFNLKNIDYQSLNKNKDDRINK